MANMPVPQSSKAILFEGHPTNEGWESTLMWFYPLSFVLTVAVFNYAPETEIQTWARQEAEARMALGPGATIEYGVHYQNLQQEATQSQWEKFAEKAFSLNEDDDDDDDEDEEEEEEDEEDDE